MMTWLSSFLNNHNQSVRINGSTSSWTSVTSGVPQGICSSKPHLSLRSIIAAGMFTCDG